MIAYTMEFAGGDVYLLQLDGGAKLNLTPSHDALSGPRWAPRGSAVAYAVSRPCGHPRDECSSTQIVIHRSMSAPRELIDEDEFADHYSFAWSPDAMRIAFDRSLFPQDDAVYLKTIGEPGLTRVIRGGWKVLDWATR